MAAKRFLLSAALLAAALVIAACTSIAPTTPTDAQSGAVEFIIDLSELEEQGIVVAGASVRLVRSSTVFEPDMAVSGSTVTGSVTAVAVGRWQATIDLLNSSGGVLATRRFDVNVQRDVTTYVSLVARVTDGRVVLEQGEPPGYGGPGSGPGGDEPGGGNGDKPGGGNGDGPGGGSGPGDNPGGNPGEQPTVTREIRYIQSGSRTETRTEVYIIRSSVPGPTAFLVGGMHGSETSGWIVAGEVAETWNIDRGTLVVIPQANKDAVRRQRRTGRDGRNLNRYFPEGRDINNPSKDWLLAKEIWDVVLEFQPVALLDLHEGWGLREAGDRFSDGTLSVGQTIITYPAGDALEFARHAADVLNTYHNPFYGVAGLTYEFRIIGPPIAGSLARKAGADLGIPAFIFEPTQGRSGRHTTTVAQRAEWQRVMVEEFLRWYGLLD